MPSNLTQPNPDRPLALEIQKLKQELADQQAQANATAEVLKAIEVSPSDTQPVFDAIAKAATELCAAQFCELLRRKK